MAESDVGKILVKVNPGVRLYEGGISYQEGQRLKVSPERLPAIKDLVTVIKKGA